MRVILVALLLLVGAFHGVSFAREYKITGVIDVGPGHSIVFTPVKWSPDGSKLAFFSDGHLTLSDTLGNRERIVEINKLAWKYEWFSNREIMIKLANRFVGPEQLNQLVIVDVETKTKTIFKEYIRKKAFSKESPESFMGPYRSIEGNLYYKTNVVGRNAKEEIVYPQSQYETSLTKLLPENNHRIQRYENSQCRIINGNNEEIEVATPLVGNYDHTPVIVKNDMTYLMIQGYIHGIDDSILINVNSYIGIKPPEHEYYYTTEGGAFNPNSNEIITTIPFYNEQEQEHLWTGIFDFDTKQLLIVDTLLKLEQSGIPSYSPNGRLIATQSKGRILIITREEE